MERADKLGINTSTLDRTVRLQTYFLWGEPNEVQRLMTLVAGQPDEFLATEALAGTQLFSGEYRQAAMTTQRAYDRRGWPRPGRAGKCHSDQRASRGYAGLCEGKEEAVQKAWLWIRAGKRSRRGVDGGHLRQRQAGGPCLRT